jgi:hypothetical protein
MADYSPVVVSEMDVRNFVTPPLDYNDVSTAEILLKIESMEEYVSRVFFNGGSLNSDARIPVLLLIISNLISTPRLAKKYYTLSSERLGDYSYTLAQPISRGTDIQSSPFIVSKTWHQAAIEMLNKLASPSDYVLRKVND